MKLLPREEKFYTYFRDQAEVIAEAAKLLLEGVQTGSTHMATMALEIKSLEEKGDEIIHEIYVRLNQTFITPIDPEDIHSLSSHLDDVLDGIEDAAHRLVSYRLEEIPPLVVELCTVVRSCVASLQLAFDALSQDKPVLEHCIEINRLEEVADKLVRDSVRDLFQNENNPITIIKLKEIYELLEATTDRCEDVADALQNVVVKNF